MPPEKLCSLLSGEEPMLTKGKQYAEIFVFISRSKTTHIASFLFSDSWFSAAQIAKILPLALTVALIDNHLVLHARCNCGLFVCIVVGCIARQADRKGETVEHFHNCMKVLLQFRTRYCTNLRQYSKSIAEDVRKLPTVQRMQIQ